MAKKETKESPEIRVFTDLEWDQVKWDLAKGRPLPFHLSFRMKTKEQEKWLREQKAWLAELRQDVRELKEAFDEVWARRFEED